MERWKYSLAVERYADAVFRAAFSVLGRREDAEDVTQEVFLRLWRRERTFECEDHMRFWLIRVAVNEARRTARRAGRLVPLEDAPDTPGDTPGDTGLGEAVAALPEKYRVPLYLHYYEGLNLKEVAKLLGCPESTVQTRLARARKKLEKTLKEEE